MLLKVKNFKLKKDQTIYRIFSYNCNMNVICYFNSIVKRIKLVHLSCFGLTTEAF